MTNPRSGYFGGTVAAPVFRKIADYCYSSMVESHEAINNSNFVYTDATLPRLPVGNKDDMKQIFDHLKMPYKEDTKSDWTLERMILLHFKQDLLKKMLCQMLSEWDLKMLYFFWRIGE